MSIKETPHQPTGKQTFGDLQLAVANYAETLPANRTRFGFTKREWSGEPEPEKLMLIGALKID